LRERYFPTLGVEGTRRVYTELNSVLEGLATSLPLKPPLQ
jgi:hypothetical protein